MGEFVSRLLLIVPAADQARANAAALQFDPVGGAETFRCGLSPTGSAPATHYWASGVMRPDMAAAVVALVASDFPTGAALAWDMDADPGLAQRELASRGLKVVRGA